MKTSCFPLLLAALVLAVPAGARIGPNPADQTALKIIQTQAPVFPLTLAHTQVMEGDTAIAIDVDQEGRLTDWLVTAYSRKEFADSAVAALKVWNFEPPRLNGQPWSSVQELRFDYSRTGVVVNLTGMEMLSYRMDELAKSSYVYRTYTLRELDRIPTPVKVVAPAMAPPLDADQTKRSVTVEFYIDEQGRVRLPSVARSDAGTVYAASALEAVKQWQFEPPLYKGRPVLVVARQEFKFVTKL